VYYSNYVSVNNGIFTLFQNRVGDFFFYFSGMFNVRGYGGE